jgi:fluoroquinolone transport system permease protein
MNTRRFIAAMSNDIRFQYRYGFYLLYLVVSIVYAGVLLAAPQSWRPLAAAVILFSDPAALGMFFMGGIVLFEKSERTLDFLFVSPLTTGEYLWAKVLSLAVVSTLAGLAIQAVAIQKGTVILAAALFSGSVLFSLTGLATAARVRSLNRFFMTIAPITLVLWIPPFMVLGQRLNLWHLPGPEAIWNLHPGTALFQLMLDGKAKHLITIAAWIAAMLPAVNRRVKGMVSELGGMQL